MVVVVAVGGYTAANFIYPPEERGKKEGEREKCTNGAFASATCKYN